MLKIKKGIKKKIKGKKDKNDEIFTPEELEKYKREKEEEARRLAGQQEQQPQEVFEEKENLSVAAQAQATFSEETEGATGTSETQEASGTKKKEDWRNFFSATDTILKETSDNLEHIKEASYFQKKEEKVPEPSRRETVAPVSVVAVAAPAPTAAPSGGKRWADLDTAIDEDLPEAVAGEVKEPEEPEPEPEKELVPLQFIEDLPDVDVDDFTEVFDTTYVDNVESGQVKLHYIPDSPTTEDPNEPDPFDTSEFDKVLHPEEPKPRKGRDDKAQQLKQPQQPEKKKKKKLVNLGCAVDVLTGKFQTAEKPSGTPTPDSKRRRVIPKEVNLFADAADYEVAEQVEVSENEEKETTEKTEANNLLDDILCVPETVDLPDVGTVLCPTPRATSPSGVSDEDKAKDNFEINFDNDIECENKEVDLSEFLELNGEDQESKEAKQDSGKDLDLKDLVAEFDIIDKSEVINETLIPDEPDVLEDEFDAEFAFLAAESVAKSKEKEFEDLEDDPFDTSVAAHVLGPEDTVDTEKDPFDVSFAEETLGEGTSKVKPGVDHLASQDTTLDLSETLQPHSGANIPTSESFDPFDTSIAESFGKTELKVLATELLTTNQKELKEDTDDFDFDPRANEPIKKEAPPKHLAPCLLTTAAEEVGSGPVLTPSQNTQEEEFDPFDTSIAAKVAIQSLEAELLTDSSQQIPDTKKQPPHRPPSPGHIFAITPTDTNPALQPSNPGASEGNKNLNLEPDQDFDPFDTSIAEKFGKTELKAIEDVLLTNENAAKAVDNVERERPGTKSLELPVKPLHPPSPKCLLAATPLDECPTLQPTFEPSDINSSVPGEDFDPFDTSIADQFGKTELKVLESEFLVTAKSQRTEHFDEFDPRAEETPPKPSKPSRPLSPANPQCLLTATPAGTPPGSELLAPTESKTLDPTEDFDPFDTSIAEKFGKTELKQLESELLSAANTTADPFDDFDPRGEVKKPPVPQKPGRPGRPANPAAPCLLATTPTDQSVTLQPCATVQEPKEGVTPEDFDPFDTTIAEKLCKTEIKALEESFLAKNNTEPEFNSRSEVSALKTVPDPSLTSSTTPNFSADHFLSSPPVEALGPTLQPIQGQHKREEADFDPFDTSIAEKFGKTELKTLESELLSDSGIKKNISDDEFDPRGEDTKAPRHPPPPAQKSATPVSLLDSSEETSIPDQPILASQAQSTADTIEDYDPFDTSIAANIGPSKAELKYLESELLSASQDPFDTSNIG